MTGALAQADRRERGADAPPLPAVVTLAWRFRRRPEEPEGVLRVRVEIEGEVARERRWEATVGARSICVPDGASPPALATVDPSRGLLHLDGAPELTATIDLRTGGALYARTALLGAIGAGPGSHELIDAPAMTRG